MQINVPPGYQLQNQPDGSQVMVPIAQTQAHAPYPATYTQGPAQPLPQGYWAQGQPPAPPPPPQAPAYGPPPGYGPPPQGFYAANPGIPPRPQAPAYGPPPGPPMPAQAMAPRMPMAPAQFHLPTEAEVRGAIDAANRQAQAMAQRRSRGGRLNELRFYGPNGQRRWDATIPIGYVAEAIFRFLPPASQGQLWFYEAKKHFWKSRARPQGDGGWCPGSGCLLCAKWEEALASGNEAFIKAAQWAKAKPHRLYQGLRYGAVEEHRTEDGRLRPLIFDAPYTVHEALMRIIPERGVHMVLDPFRGMPIKIQKKKTGPDSTDVEYGVLDLWNLAGPIPPEFGFGPQLEGLEFFDLQKVAQGQMLSADQQQAALVNLGLVPQAQPASYQAGPPPNPYGGQPQQPPVGPPPGTWQAAAPGAQPYAPQAQVPQAHPGGPAPVGPPGWGPSPPQAQAPSPYAPANPYPPQAPSPGAPVLPRGEAPSASYRAPIPQADAGPPPGWTPPPQAQPQPWQPQAQAAYPGPQNGPAYAPPYPAPQGADEPPF